MKFLVLWLLTKMHTEYSAALLCCTEMHRDGDDWNTTRILWETHGNGSQVCGTPVGMEKFMRDSAEMKIRLL